MGKQSARLYYQGKDHKEIYYNGHYHDRMYMGSQLVWEKLKGGIRWTAYESAGSTGDFIRYNGSRFVLIDYKGRVYYSEDAITWTGIGNPLPEEDGIYCLQDADFNICGTLFVTTKKYYHYRVDPAYQFAVSADGISWRLLDTMTVQGISGEYVTYKAHFSEKNYIYVGMAFYENGTYLTYGSGTAGGTMTGQNLIDFKTKIIKDGNCESGMIYAWKYINGYYYFISDTTLRTNMVSFFAGIWRSKDMKEFEFLKKADGISGMRKFSECKILAYQDLVAAIIDYKVYYTKNGTDFEEYKSVAAVKAGAIESDGRIAVQATYGPIYITRNGETEEYKLKDLLGEIEVVNTSNIHTFVMDQKIYIIYTDYDKIVSLIGEVE